MLFAVTSASTADSSGAFSGVTNFFDSSYFSAFEKLMILFGVALYAALVFWTWKDARRRIDDPVIVGVCVATAVCFPFVGVLIYLILRPPEYLADVHERELEIRAMEERLGRPDAHCPVCRATVEPEFLVCPVCTTKLKQACVTCKNPLEPLWQVCPYCETPIVRRSSVFEQTMALPPDEGSLRSPRRPRERIGWDEDTPETLGADQ